MGDGYGPCRFALRYSQEGYHCFLENARVFGQRATVDAVFGMEPDEAASQSQHRKGDSLLAPESAGRLQNAEVFQPVGHFRQTLSQFSMSTPAEVKDIAAKHQKIASQQLAAKILPKF